jgi:hypothetical protein
MNPIIPLLFYLFVLFIVWGQWYWLSFHIRPAAKSEWHRRVLQVTPLFCLVFINLVLRKYADPEVRNSLEFLWFYTALGIVWLAIMEGLALRLGLSARDDVFERNNAAASMAISGWLAGASLTYAGANVGTGPGWMAVVFCAVLSTGGLALVWWALDSVSGITDSISVDRDLASGFRAAGFFVGSGSILGGAVAGDWASTEATIRDFFIYGWPAVVLCALAAMGERLWRPTPAPPSCSPLVAGALPGLLYTVIGLLVLRYTWSR